MKRFLAVTLAAMFTFGNMGVTAFAADFADINKVPWSGAAQFINQAQSLGLMNGYTENGKKYAKPRNNVTLCESVQMIYSIMKVYTKKDVSSDTVTKWTTVMSAYNIPTWAYSATAYVLENKIIENSDLVKLKNGTQNATREEVGLMFGKALATIYTANNSATLSYKDSTKISRDAVPYLALLNSKNLMVGDPNNRFNPSAKINRSEMAVLSVKTYNYLNDSKSQTPTTPTAPSSGTVSGTVINSMVLTNGDIFLSVATNNGSGVNLFGKKSTVKVTFEGETVALKDIGMGDTVTVTYANTDISTVVINKSKAGIISTKVFPLKKLTSSKITVKDGSNETYFRLSDSVSVTINGSKSSVSKLISEMEDYDYTVTLSFDKINEVSKIEAMTSKNNPLAGKLTYMSNSKLRIQVGSKDYEYPLSDADVTVKYDGKTVRFSTLADEYRSNNYSVTLKLDNKGYVTSITIDFMEDETHGTLSFINSRRLDLKAAGKTYSYYLDPDVDVEIDGKSSRLSTLTDKYDSAPYSVALTLDRYDSVTKISATSKNSGLSKGTLKEITSSTIKITVDGKSYEYDLKDPSIKIDNKSVTLSSLRSSYKDYTYTVELTFNSKGEVTDIVGKNNAATKGTLRYVDAGRDQIAITAGDVNYTYDLDSDVKITLDGSTKTASKLDSENETAKYYKEKITVTLTLNSKDKVTKVVASTEDESSSDTKKGTLVKVDPYYVSVKIDSRSKDYDFIPGDVTMTLDGSSTTVNRLTSALDRLDRDESISVTLYFDNKDRVSKLVARIVNDDETDDKPKEGKLYKVTTSSDKIEIKDNHGGKYKWNVDSDVSITYRLSRRYDSDNYNNSLRGLKELLNDCESKGDTCYVTLDKVNSSDKVTKITAENQ
ncbi:S-layer homology domain protein [anaerobic digester metagenome]